MISKFPSKDELLKLYPMYSKEVKIERMSNRIWNDIISAAESRLSETRVTIEYEDIIPELVKQLEEAGYTVSNLNSIIFIKWPS